MADTITSAALDDGGGGEIFTPEVINRIYFFGILFLKLIATVLGVAAFGISARMIDFDVTKVISVFYRKTESEKKLEAMENELKTLKKELHEISEMDEFAKFHRKRRILIKLQDEFDLLSKQEGQTKMYKHFKINILSRIIIAIFAFLFSYASRDIIVAKIDERIFWPCNFLLTLPWIFTSSDHGETPVTLFNFLVLLSIFNRAYLSQKEKNVAFKKQFDSKNA
uniref:Guided entry of tail-anchored proteins factor 1 n=1 Tax=Panagrolaimus sp. PS1159 TaxID=55785 RepID=A0AC35FJ96_9BILA